MSVSYLLLLKFHAVRIRRSHLNHEDYGISSHIGLLSRARGLTDLGSEASRCLLSSVWICPCRERNMFHRDRSHTRGQQPLQSLCRSRTPKKPKRLWLGSNTVLEAYLTKHRRVYRGHLFGKKLNPRTLIGPPISRGHVCRTHTLARRSSD